MKNEALKLLNSLSEEKATYDKILEAINKLDKKSLKEKIKNELEKLEDNATFEDIKQIIEKNNPETVWRNPLPQKVFFIFGLLAFGTFIYFVFTNFNFSTFEFVKICPENKKITLLDYLFYSVWAIGPPSYFFYEYMKIFPKIHKLNSNQLSDIKYTQELASKIWAALLFIFGIILYSKYGVK